MGDKVQVYKSKYFSSIRFERIALNNIGQFIVTAADGFLRLYKNSSYMRVTTKVYFDREYKNDFVMSPNAKWVAAVNSQSITIWSSEKWDWSAFAPKPAKTSLKLTIDDKHLLKSSKFERAVFNFTKDESELTISTFIGSKVISWAFSDLMQGITDNYETLEYTEPVKSILYDRNIKDQIYIAFANSVIATRIFANEISN